MHEQGDTHKQQFMYFNTPYVACHSRTGSVVFPFKACRRVWLVCAASWVLMAWVAAMLIISLCLSDIATRFLWLWLYCPTDIDEQQALQSAKTSPLQLPANIQGLLHAREGKRSLPDERCYLHDKYYNDSSTPVWHSCVAKGVNGSDEICKAYCCNCEKGQWDSQGLTVMHAVMIVPFTSVPHAT